MITLKEMPTLYTDVSIFNLKNYMGLKQSVDKVFLEGVFHSISSPRSQANTSAS
jgi:hypothetical protein